MATAGDNSPVESKVQMLQEQTPASTAAAAAATTTADGAEEHKEPGAYHWIGGQAVWVPVSERADPRDAVDGTPDPNAPPEEPYCWEDGGDESASSWKRLRHTLHWAGYKAFYGAEFVGEVVAEFLGLNQSRYQWVIDLAERERQEAADRKKLAQYRRELQVLAELQAAQEAAEAAESGAASGAPPAESADEKHSDNAL